MNINIPIGDCVIEVINHAGHPIPSAYRIMPDPVQAASLAPDLARLHGASRWRVFQCVADSASPLPLSRDAT